MKKSIVLLLFFSVASCLWAQSDNGYAEWKRQQQASYRSFKDSARAQYEAFRQKANADYALFKKEHCVTVVIHPPIKADPIPKPPRPVIAPPDRIPSSDPLPYHDVVPPTVPLPQRDIPLPLIDEPAPQPPSFTFAFYGASCSVELGQDHRFRLDDISSQSLANAWQLLSSDAFDPLLRDCLQYRSALQLDDWGYIDFVRTLSRSFFASECNEAVLLQQYLLLNSGMMVRLCFVNGQRLVLVVPFQEKILGYPYYFHDDVQYFVIQPTDDDDLFLFYDKGFDGEQQPSIRMTQLPNLPLLLSPSRSFASKRYPSLALSLAVNKNLIDLMRNRPWHMSLWNYYAEAGLSSQVKDALYPLLRQHIDGKDQLSAANMLLDFVQHAFDYATDQDQFGKERSLFADESFFYPYNDCEDRSILFSILVRDLLHLPVVLLHFKNHLATAVCFSQRVDGDFLFIDDDLYVICDPTYIGASVGMAMPDSKAEGALLNVWPLAH